MDTLQFCWLSYAGPVEDGQEPIIASPRFRKCFNTNSQPNEDFAYKVRLRKSDQAQYHELGQTGQFACRSIQWVFF